MGRYLARTENYCTEVDVDEVTGAVFYLDGSKSYARQSEWEADGYKFEAIKSTVETKTKEVSGGPSGYYDMPFSDWVTTNDMMEYLAEHKWGKYGIHCKDLFKALCRWGDKDGTTVEYDAKKIVYYGVRILRLISGNSAMREYLQDLLDDPQFKDR